MMNLVILAIISSIAFGLLLNYRRLLEHRKQLTSSVLFKTEIRTFFISFISLGGLVVHLISLIPLTYPDDPVGSFGYALIVIGLPTLLSYDMARSKRGKENNTQKRKVRAVSSIIGMTPCFQQLKAKLANSEDSQLLKIDSSKNDSEKILYLSQRISNPLFFMDLAYSLNLTDTCVDEILWTVYFDMFEKKKPHILSPFRTDYKKYSRGKTELLERDDEKAERFRESLHRWRLANQEISLEHE